MSKSWKTLIVAIVMAGGVSSVAIADGYDYEYEPVGKSFAAPAEVFSWTGFYIGGHVGYSWLDVSGGYDTNDPPNAVNLNGLNIDGSFGGIQLGYNYQMQQFVVGIEGDWSWLNNSDTITRTVNPRNLTAEIDYLASIRARFGWAWQNVLAYGTVGWGWADHEFRVSNTSNATKSFEENGVVYGGGLEVGLTKSVLVRAEYLHYDVGGGSNLFTPPFADCTAGVECSVKFDDIDVVRGAISFKLY